jgi:ABC-2 type transport system permease protein
MRLSMHAEWTKLRTSPGTIWLFLAVIAATVGLSTVAAATAACAPAGCALDAAKVSLTGVTLGQAVVAVLAVLGIGTEYSTGMIRLSLVAMPRRITVLTAKAAVLTGVVAAAAGVAVLGSLVAGRPLLPPGTSLSFVDAHVVRAATGSVLYLVLIGLLSIGIATAVRNSGAAIGIVLGLLYLFPIIALAVPDRDWQRRLERIGPMTAGRAIQETTDLSGLPISPWAGLGVLAAWAAVALLAGGLLLHGRDA